MVDANGCHREMARKNSQGALMELMDLYERFEAEERELADKVIAEWIRSDNKRKRFDALALVDPFGIRAAIGELRSEEVELVGRTDPEAPYELAKVRRILERLEA